MKCMDADESFDMLESPTRIERSRSRRSSPQPGPSNGSCLRSIQQTNRIPLNTLLKISLREHY